MISGKEGPTPFHRRLITIENKTIARIIQGVVTRFSQSQSAIAPWLGVLSLWARLRKTTKKVPRNGHAGGVIASRIAATSSRQSKSFFRRMKTTAEKTLAIGLAGGAVFGLGLLCFRKVRKNAWVEVCLGVLGLGAGSLICAKWELVGQFLTENGKGEPLVILEGVSVWPTVLLRGLGIVLALYFIWRAVWRLHENLATIASDMDLEPKPASWWEEIVSDPKTKRSLSKKVMGLFDFTLGNDQAPQTLQVAAA
jgi:hypothetical protein